MSLQHDLQELHNLEVKRNSRAHGLKGKKLTWWQKTKRSLLKLLGKKRSQRRSRKSLEQEMLSRLGSQNLDLRPTGLATQIVALESSRSISKPIGIKFQDKQSKKSSPVSRTSIATSGSRKRSTTDKGLPPGKLLRMGRTKNISKLEIDDAGIVSGY